MNVRAAVPARARAAAVPGRARLAGIAGIVALALAPSTARAYTYASPLASGCHEAISLAALRAVRAHGDGLEPWPTARDDRLWIDDLPLDLPRDARDSDLKGTSGLDTSELALVHGDPDAQMEHCLRRPEHDEPAGSAAALAECRAFIRDRVRDALDEGLDVRGRADPEARIEVELHLAFAGQRRVAMPRFAVQLGRALHALQDSFSHALRSEDGLRVRALLNWVDFAEERHDPARDGPVHRAELDDCENLDELRARRLALATQASAELLAAASDAARSRRARMDAVDAVLDRYLSYEPGCSADDGFCDAPELAYAVSASGCAVVPGTRDARPPSWLGALLAASLLAARRVQRRRSAREPRNGDRRGVRGALCATVLGGAVLLVPASGAAQPERATAAAAAREQGSRFALAGEFGAAVDQASAAVALGGRYRAAERWLLGVNLEWNPWLSLETSRARSGTLNAYGSVAWRAPLNADVALRIWAHLGAALLLFDVHGAPSGSVGPYVGLSLLSIEIALASNLKLLLEPADVVVTMPHVTGIPLTRRQYRATVGLELSL